MINCRTLSQFHGTEIFLSSIFHGIGIFLLSFSVSMALGVCFGLAMSLILKHSSLTLYPGIESCLVALSAYTCYFFSNGISMSGIVSLLFCGITLKHYAYHTMSRRTQRTTKYIFATLAQLTENFIFIYLGLSLFTSPPSSEKVTNYVKPLFIVITTIAVVFTRYAAVFPLSEAINFFHRHARGQRTDELPHSYQMMLFWAGLRGAVGVALAAGFKGENAQTLRTTVLVVVVHTVVMFGGTTARMLEVLGIRTGVEDEAASSSEDEVLPSRSWNSRQRWARNGYVDEDRIPRSSSSAYLASQQGYGNAAARVGAHYAGPSRYNHQALASSDSPIRSASVFSAASSESYDSDGGEVLPLASASRGNAHDEEAGPGAVHEGEGQWFHTIDERYLIPLFSNATASRTFHARKARRTTGLGIGAEMGVMAGAGEDVNEEDEGAEVELGVPNIRMGGIQGGPGMPMPPGGVPGGESRTERGLPSPILRRESEGGQKSP